MDGFFLKEISPTLKNEKMLLLSTLPLLGAPRQLLGESSDGIIHDRRRQVLDFLAYEGNIEVTSFHEDRESWTQEESLAAVVHVLYVCCIIHDYS